MAITRQQLHDFLTNNVAKNTRGRYVVTMARGEDYKINSANLNNVWEYILNNNFDDNVELFENPNARNDSMFSIQVRLEWKEDVGEFTQPFKKTLISIFQQSIRETLSSCGTDTDIIIEAQKCCLVTYDAHYRNKLQLNVKNTTLRLSFPNLVIPVGIQQEIFNYAVIKCRRAKILQLLSKIPHVLDLKNIMSMLNNAPLQVLLLNTYPQYGFYGIVGEGEYNLNNCAIKITDVFDLRCHQDIMNNGINYDRLVNTVGDRIERYMPFLMSRNYGASIPINYNRTFKRQPNICNIGEGYKRSSEYSLIQLTELFLNMLSDDRFYIRPDFMNIGRALYSIYEGDNEGKNVWFRCAERAMDDNGELPEHLLNLEDYAIEYMKFAEKDYGIDVRTLAWYAKEDSPDDYHEWQDSWILSAIEKAVTDVNERNLSIIFYRITWLTLLTAPSENKTVWYRYTGSIWKRSSNSNAIVKIFSDELIERLESIMYRLIERDGCNVVDIDGSTPEQSPYIKQLRHIINKVSSHGTMRSILSWSASQLEVENFNDYKDANLNLTAMLDGVVESSYRTKSIIFRSGKPQDYLTLCTYKTFPVHYTWNTPEVKRYVRWIKQMYHSKELCKHFYKLIASAYVGGNLHKIIVFMTGVGNNGKSTMVRCLSDSFGDYVSMFPFNLLTSDAPDPTKPCPLSFTLSGPRLSFGLEAGDKDLRSDVIKIKTGNDIEVATLKYSNEVRKLTPTTTMVAVVNDIPPMRGFGSAIRSRFKRLPNDTIYDRNAPEDKLMQKLTRVYPLDPRFIDDVGQLAQAVLWTSYQFFPVYAEEGLDDPPEVIKATDEYWRETDVYAMFIDEKLEAVFVEIDGVSKRDISAKLSIDVAYNAFNIWYMERYPNQFCPNRTNFSRYMLDCNLVGKSINRCWEGIRLVNNTGMNGMNNMMGGWNPAA